MKNGMLFRSHHPACSCLLLVLPAVVFSPVVHAQQQPIASVATDGVQLKNAMSVANGRATIANNGEVTAGIKTAQVSLERGGSLLVCASTTLQMARDASSSTGKDAALMFSLNRGAFETDYKTGSYSDVVMTPDLRLLISPPGTAQVKLRVNEQGDTCVDNSGANAPYVTVSSLMDGGVYRVKPGQRVEFVGGSLARVVDNEREPCGCPEAEAVSAPGTRLSAAAVANPFPAAVSEELAPPPGPPSEPVVPDGVAHAEVQATLSSDTPPGPPPPEPAAVPSPQPSAAPSSVPPQHRGGFFHGIGRFFARVFGADRSTD